MCQLLAAKSTYPPLVSYDSHLSSFLSYWVTREGDEVEVDRSIWYFFFKVHRRTPLIYHLPAGIGFFEKFGEGCSSFLFSSFFFSFLFLRGATCDSMTPLAKDIIIFFHVFSFLTERATLIFLTTLRSLTSPRQAVRKTVGLCGPFFKWLNQRVQKERERQRQSVEKKKVKTGC